MNWRTRCTKYSPTCPLVFTSGRTYRTVLTTGRDENTSCPVGTEYTIRRRRQAIEDGYFDTANANKLSVRVHGGQSSEFPIYPTTLERTIIINKRRRPARSQITVLCAQMASSREHDVLELRSISWRPIS